MHTFLISIFPLFLHLYHNKSWTCVVFHLLVSQNSVIQLKISHLSNDMLQLFKKKVIKTRKEFDITVAKMKNYVQYFFNCTKKIILFRICSDGRCLPASRCSLERSSWTHWENWDPDRPLERRRPFSCAFRRRFQTTKISNTNIKQGEV